MMTSNMKVIWLNRILNIVALLGFSSSTVSFAASRIKDVADVLANSGMFPAKWTGWFALVGALGALAAKWSKTPSQAIAAAVPPIQFNPKPPTNDKPFPGVKDPPLPFILIGLVVSLLSCSHTPTTVPPVVATVIKDCSPPSPEFVDLVGDTLDGADYITALENLAKETALCVVNDAVKQAVNAVGATGKLKAGESVRVLHGQAWLAAHST